MDAETRVKEMEASIRAIAEYVKKQTEKLESEIASKGEGDAEQLDDMEELKRKLESFSDEKEFSSLQFKKLDKLEERLNDRIEKVEEIIKGSKGRALEEKLRKSLQETRAELDGLKRELVPKAQYIEEKLNKVKAVADEQEELKAKLKKLEKLFEAENDRIDAADKAAKEAKAAVAIAKSFDFNAYRSGLEKINTEMTENFRQSMPDAAKAAELEQRLNAAEQSLGGGPIKEMEKKLEELKGDVGAFASLDIEGMAERVGFIDKKLNESLVLKNHLQDMEKSLAEMRATTSKLKGIDYDAYRREVEAHVDRALEQFRSLEADEIKKLGKMAEQFRNFEADDIRRLTQVVGEFKDAEAADIKKLGSMVDQLKGFEAEDIKNLGAMFSQLKGIEAGDIRKLTRMMEEFKGLEVYDIKNLADTFSHLKNTEARDIRKMTEMMEELKHVEIVDIRKLREMVEHFKDIGVDDIRGLSDMLSKLKGMEAGDIKRLSKALEELKHVEIDDIAGLSRQVRDAKSLIRAEAENRQQFEERLNKTQSEIEEARKSEKRFDKHINELLEQYKQLEAHDVKNISKNVTEAKDLLEEESVSRMAFERRVMEMEQKLQQAQKHTDKVMESIKQLEAQDMEKLVEDLHGAKEAQEEESVSRISLERQLRDMEERMQQMRSKVDKAEDMEGLDMTKINSRLSDMEAGMKMDALRMLTQQLNNFAKSMDRRLPNVVSREEYMRQIAELNQRMHTVEAPDLSPLGARVDRLEKKIEEVAAMMRSVYNRIPIVVE